MIVHCVQGGNGRRNKCLDDFVLSLVFEPLGSPSEYYFFSSKCNILTPAFWADVVPSDQCQPPGVCLGLMLPW